MNKIIKYRYLFMVPSALIIIAGLVMLFTVGFNTGIDFSSGLSEEIQIAPGALSRSYDGAGSATLSASQGELKLTIKEGQNSKSYIINPQEYKTAGEAAAFFDTIEGISVKVKNSELLMSNVVTGASYPVNLSSSMFNVNCATETSDVSISDIRDALSSMDGLNVQVAGDKNDGSFLVKVKVKEGETQYH